jgi:hypothetical protein
VSSVSCSVSYVAVISRTSYPNVLAISDYDEFSISNAVDDPSCARTEFFPLTYRKVIMCVLLVKVFITYLAHTMKKISCTTYRLVTSILTINVLFFLNTGGSC